MSARGVARGGQHLAARIGSFGAESVAVMLGVDAGRLRTELSNIRPASRLLIGGLLVSMGCAVAGTLIGMVYVTSSSAIPNEQSDTTVAPTDVRSRGAFDAIVMRPLFSRSRQPAAVPAEPAAATLPAMADRQISLKGVLINGKLAKAFMLSAQNPVGAWRQIGDEFDGWRVAEIARDHVVLQNSADRFVVPLSYSNSR